MTDIEVSLDTYNVHGDILDEKSEIKTVIEYGVNANGDKIKITKKIKVTTKTFKIKKAILERQNYSKFGDCEGFDPGFEENVSYQSPDIIHLNFKHKNNNNAPITPQKKIEPITQNSSFLCRFCNERGHMSMKCPNKKDKDSETPDDKNSNNLTATPTDRYRLKTMDVNEESLHVTNLSEEANENDLYELFGSFGSIYRVFIGRDYITRKSRGFAYVTFTNKKNAQTAIDVLNGYGYDNLILCVEWSKKKNPK